jgi:hypothetical protein
MAVKSPRSWFALVAMLGAAGCQAIAPAADQQLTRSGAGQSGQQVVSRDDDTFSGRLKTETQAMTAATRQQLDPNYWKSQGAAKAKQKELKKKQLAAQRSKQPRSRLASWLFPEPKKPQTLSEWLTQERPDA